MDTAEIMGWHEQGVGFGIIAMAYYAATVLGDGTTAGDLITKKLDGMGWGEIMKEAGLSPGQFGKEGSLGKIMSAEKKNKAGDAMQGTGGPPGQTKHQNQEQEQEQNQNAGQGHGKDGKEFAPPSPPGHSGGGKGGGHGGGKGNR